MTVHNTPGPVLLDVHMRAGLLELTTADVETTTVEMESLSGESGEAAIAASEQECLLGKDGGATVRLRVPAKSGRRLFSRDAEVCVRVTAPRRTRLDCATASADVRVGGSLDAIDAKTASGDVTAVEVAGDATVKTMSGGIRVGAIGGDAEMRTMSGDVALGSVSGTADLKTMSGDVAVASAASSTDVSTMSGDVRLDGVARGEVDVKTASGDVSVGILRGTRAWLDVKSSSGQVDSDLDHQDDGEPAGDVALRLRVVSGSGDVRLRRAGQEASV